MAQTTEKIDRLFIKGLAFGGAGVGHHEGKAVFVPFTAPGDLVSCRVVQEKKRFLLGEIEMIIESSPHRREPLCPVFGTCGGCHWQHLPYAVQCHWKETVFYDALQRFGKVPAPERLPVLSASSEWSYRHRVQVKCHWAGERLAMGFFRRGSHFVVDAPGCPIAHPKLNRAWEVLRQALADPVLGEKIPQIELETGDGPDLRVVVHYLGDRTADLIKMLDPFALAEKWSWFIQSGRKSTLKKIRGKDLLTYSVDDPPLELGYGPGGFSQVNLKQNQSLVHWIIEQVPLQGDDMVLDLFCGAGNLSLPLARRVKFLTGIEEYRPAVELAKRYAIKNRLHNTEFFAAKADDAVGRQGRLKGPFDLVVLDPPRQGAYHTVRLIITLKPRRILYVSCDPITLSRDLKPLLEGGYRVLSAVPIDFFPQTYHIEGVVLLEAPP